MSREGYMTDDYFSEFISEQNERINKFTMVLKQLDTEDYGKRVRCTRILANYYRDLISAKYSIGANGLEIARIFKLYADSLLVCKVADYAEMVDVLSLLILLNKSYIEYENLISDSEYDDGLVVGLKQYLRKKNYLNDKKLLYADYYEPFMLYLSGKMSDKQFKEFVECEWYGRSSEFSWYDSHKRNDNTYVGYWCWLAAALVKIKKSGLLIEKYVPNEIEF